jgi:hypothetical protein
MDFDEFLQPRSLGVQNISTRQIYILGESYVRFPFLSCGGW